MESWPRNTRRRAARRSARRPHRSSRRRATSGRPARGSGSRFLIVPVGVEGRFAGRALRPVARQRGLSDSLWSWTLVRRTAFRPLGGGRVYNGAIRDRQNGNPGQRHCCRSEPDSAPIVAKWVRRRTFPLLLTCRREPDWLKPQGWLYEEVPKGNGVGGGGRITAHYGIQWPARRQHTAPPVNLPFEIWRTVYGRGEPAWSSCRSSTTLCRRRRSH